MCQKLKIQFDLFEHERRRVYFDWKDKLNIFVSVSQNVKVKNHSKFIKKIASKQMQE